MDKSKQLTLFDCARKRCRTSSGSDSGKCDDVVVHVTDSADEDSDSEESNTSCWAVQTLDRGEPGDHLEQMEQMETQADIQESQDVIDCTVHGSPYILHSSPDVVSESGISDEHESVAIQTPDSDSRCSNAASILQHIQHKPCSDPTDIAQGPPFPPVQPVGIKFPKTTFGNRTRSFNPAWYKRYEWLLH